MLLLGPIPHLFNGFVAQGDVDGFEWFALLRRDIYSRLPRRGLTKFVNIHEILFALKTGGDLVGKVSEMRLEYIRVLDLEEQERFVVVWQTRPELCPRISIDC